MDNIRIFYFIILLIPLTRSEDVKSSLVFVIDDTGSMSNDIDQVKKSTNMVFDTVMKSKSSQIENFVLVTFNDPTTNLRTVTKNRDEFKRKLQEIHVYGGDDCPEMAMGGIQTALEHSLPGSFIYVFTDASAKDARLLEKIQDMAISKKTQIVFLLTGRCSGGDSDPQYQAYHTLSAATNGQVFHTQKNEISEILKYVAESITSRKSVIATHSYPPGYGHHLTIPVDPAMKDLTVAVSGSHPKVEVTAPDGSKPAVKTIVNLPTAVAVKVPTAVPGNYTSTVGSKSGTTVVLTVTSTLRFKHGFSGIVPTTLKDTDSRPVPGNKAYLSIELETDNSNNVLDAVEIMDVKENIIIRKPLTILDKDQKLYVTDTLDPPNHLFKIAIIGHNTKDGSSFRRPGPTAIQPQIPKFVTTINRSPSIVINGGPKFVVDYDETVKMSCKATGYPKPLIVWMDKSGSILSSTVSTVTLPYDFINVLEIHKAKESQTYTCVASNIIGNSTQTAEVKVKRKKFFKVLEIPKDITIEYLRTGSVTCKIDAFPPATISWLGNGRNLITGSDFNISPDGSILNVKNMKKDLKGLYSCEAGNDGNRKTYNFNIDITGFDAPSLNKAKTEKSIETGKDAELNCRIIKGAPTPNIVWYFKSKDSKDFNKINKTGETLLVTKANIAQSGTYKCIASNDAGQDTHETILIVGYVPIINREVNYVAVRQGDRKTLNCVTNGIPEPIVEWYFNGAKVVSNKKYNISSDNSLSFSGSIDTEGQYLCVASNTYGSSSIGTRVQYFDVPSLIKAKTEESIEMGKDVEVNCRIIKGAPKPNIVWYFKSKDSKDFNKINKTGETLLVTKANIAQSGTYKCIASNDAGQDTHETVLIVGYVPIINREVNYVTARQGDRKTLNCVTNGIPEPIVEWYFNGKKVVSNKKYNISSDNSLSFTGSIDIEGQYLCVASNTYGSSSIGTQVQYIVTPEIDKATNIERIERSKDVQIYCIINKGTPKPQINWFFKPENNSTYTEISDNKDELLLRNVGTQHSGTYKCVATNIAGKDEHKTDLIVGYVPIINSEVKNVTARQDERKTLKCVTNGIPEPIVEWYFNGAKVVSNKKYNISSDNSLSFSGSIDTEGQYLCVASNAYGSSSIGTLVQYIVKPEIDKAKNIERIERRKDVQIYCTITKGTPKPQINWFIKRENNSTYTKISDKKEVLLLRNVGTQHSGTYKCVATNIAGKDEHKTDLFVGYAPTIQRDSRNVLSRAGTRISLKCVTGGIPKPKVEWFFNGVKIVSDRNHSIYRDNSLRFTGYLHNHGDYYCVASNTYGTATKITRVTVVVPVQIQPPKKSTIEVRVGDHLSLPCVADGFPPPKIEWLFTSAGTKHRGKRRPTDASGSLNLGTVQLHHDGFYTCNASNGESTSNFTYQLSVLAPPYIDKHIKKDYKAVDGDLVLTVPCKAIGIPKPDVTWTKDKRNIAAGSPWYDIGKDGTLVIKNIDIMSAGTYVCHARNKVGSDSNYFKVQIDPYPDGEMPKKTVYLEKNSYAVLPCDIPHTRVDSFRWFKDGKVISKGNYTISSVQDHHVGIYICRISTFTSSSSAQIEVKIGSRPEFKPENSSPEESFNYDEGYDAYLECEANGAPKPEVTWTHNGKKMPMNEMVTDFVMTPDTIGNYTCVVENQFGSISRNFEIIPEDCFINIREEFTTKQPLLIELPFHRLPQYENHFGYLKIVSRQKMELYCPSGFTNLPTSNVTAYCMEGQFFVDGVSYKYSEFDCKEEIKPIIKKTGKECKSRNTERIKIGYEKEHEFLEVYEVCFDKNKNVPIYSKQKIHRTYGDTDLKNDTNWLEDDLMTLNSNVYFCEKQITQISYDLSRPFHVHDNCCFKDRLLVNPRDLLSGLPQKAALSHLNVVPQWSTCGTANWDVLEKKVRFIAKETWEGLTVWTGTNDHLQLRDSSNKYQSINLRDSSGHSQPVPKFLWKVIQEPHIMKASLAVIQFNIPDLTMREAKKLMPCNDICNSISWLIGTDWQNTSRGFTICCSLEDFERNFGYSKEFGYYKAILNRVSHFSSHSV